MYTTPKKKLLKEDVHPLLTSLNSYSKLGNYETIQKISDDIEKKKAKEKEEERDRFLSTLCLSESEIESTLNLLKNHNNDFFGSNKELKAITSFLNPKSEIENPIPVSYMSPYNINSINNINNYSPKRKRMVFKKSLSLRKKRLRELRELHYRKRFSNYDNGFYSHEFTKKLFNVNHENHHKYNIVQESVKEKCLNDLHSMPTSLVAKKYGISKRNLNRWKIKGIHRKKGSGRKAKDPELDQKLFRWYLSKNGERITSRMLKEKALQLSSNKTFIASTGWLTKFKSKFHIQLAKY